MDNMLFDIVYQLGELAKSFQTVSEENVQLKQDNLVLKGENNNLILEQVFLKDQLETANNLIHQLQDLDNRCTGELIENYHGGTLDGLISEAESLSGEIYNNSNRSSDSFHNESNRTLNTIMNNLSRKDTRVILKEKCVKLESKLQADQDKIDNLVKSLNVYIKKFQEINGPPITSKQLDKNPSKKSMILKAPSVLITRLNGKNKESKERFIELEADHYLTFTIKRRKRWIDIRTARIMDHSEFSIRIAFNYHNKEEDYLIQFKDVKIATIWKEKLSIHPQGTPRSVDGSVDDNGSVKDNTDLIEDRPVGNAMIPSRSESNIVRPNRSRAITDNQVPAKAAKWHKSHSGDVKLAEIPKICQDNMNSHQRTMSENLPVGSNRRGTIVDYNQEPIRDVNIRADSSGRRGTFFNPTEDNLSSSPVSEIPLGTSPQGETLIRTDDLGRKVTVYSPMIPVEVPKESPKWLPRNPSISSQEGNGTYKRFQSHSQGDLPELTR